MPAYPAEKILRIAGRDFTAAEITRFESGTTGVILSAGVTTAGRGTSFRTQDGVDYVVPANKKLVVKGVRAKGATSSGVSIAHSTAAVAFDTASPGTTPTYYGGSSQIYAAVVSTSQPYGEGYINFEIAASKYPFMLSSGAATACVIYCFIESV